MAYSIKFGHNFELQIPYCKQQTLLRPGNEASMEWVSDPPTSISFFSCSLVLNLFWTSLIRLNTCTSPDPAPLPCFEPARKELWRKQRREYRNGESKVQSPKCTWNVKLTLPSQTLPRGLGRQLHQPGPLSWKERERVLESDSVTQQPRGETSADLPGWKKLILRYTYSPSSLLLQFWVKVKVQGNMWRALHLASFPCSTIPYMRAWEQGCTAILYLHSRNMKRCRNAMDWKYNSFVLSVCKKSSKIMRCTIGKSLLANI